MVRFAILIGLLVPPAHPAWSGALAPDDAVAIASAALQRAGVTGASPVAPSRALPPCDGEVTAGPRQGRWSTVELTCDSPRWTRALRTRAADDPAPRNTSTREPAASDATALALTRPLARGEMITKADLVAVPMPDRAPDQVFADPADLIGRRLRQSLAPGRAILARHLAPDWIVLAEGPVTILTRTGGIEVAMQGRAQDNAAMGEIVSVTNLSSGRTIMARVIGADLVGVALKPSEKEP